MKKSLSKRIKVTKNGKIMRRAMGTDHFRTRKTQKNVRNRRKKIGIDYPSNKILNY